MVFYGQVFFSLYIANRILHIYLDPRGTSFACLLAWMGLGIKLVPHGSKCEHDRAHLRKRNLILLGPSVNMIQLNYEKKLNFHNCENPMTKIRQNAISPSHLRSKNYEITSKKSHLSRAL